MNGGIWHISKLGRKIKISHITILHCIVSTAQEQFEQASYPKPLPAAALFKAYDDVLPTFGIDPDSDHHLSALVFRIGGESGTGSLLRKFHALLKRMGIFIEFDNCAATFDSPSSLPCDIVDKAAEITALQKPGLCAQTSQIDPTTNAQDRLGPKSMQPDPRLTQDLKQQLPDSSLEPLSTKSDRKLSKISHISDDSLAEANGGAYLTFRRSAMISAIDRWRKFMHERILNRTTRYALMVANEDTRSRASLYRVDINEHIFKTDLSHPLIEIAIGAAAHDLSPDEHNALLLRAARARQIFLASRILSRWADETAIRLERDAVARRHMVRFRCFNSWLQAPNSQMPRIRCLKTLSVVQKLRRAVNGHAEQLNLMASLTAASRISILTFQILNFWLSSVLFRLSTKSIKRLVWIASINRWLVQTWNRDEVKSNIAQITRCYRYRRDLITWTTHQKRHMLRTKLAQQLAMAFARFRWLRIWRTRTEVKFRAKACRQVLAIELSARRLETWRLQARVDNFRGKRLYTYAMGHIYAWLSVITGQSALQAFSADCYRAKSALKVASHLASVTQSQQHLDVLRYRAMWYIRATLLLKHVGAAVRDKKLQMKLVVRSHLMMKYTQVSSKRRRRSFFLALFQWQSHATAFKATVTVAHRYQTLGKAIRKRAICVSWELQAVQGATSRTRAVNLREHQFLREWSKLAFVHHQQQLDAAEFWATEQQRQSLKAWARSTLQKGGQAHSADMVRRKYARDYRNRASQRWRHLSSRSKHDEIFPELQSPALTVRINNSHRSTSKNSKWPPLCRRLGVKQEALTPVDTPSRSTGLLFSSTHVPSIRFMSPAADGDKKFGIYDAQKSDVWKQGVVARKFMFGHGDMPTSTPKTPVARRVRIPSRHISTGLEETFPMVYPDRVPSLHGPQASGSVAAADQSQNDVELPRLAPDGESASLLSRPGPNIRFGIARSGPERMRHWQSGSRTGFITSTMGSEDTIHGTDGAR
ncbi:hypothetical protein E4U58_000788 [Claviceps cyperi]|nr:hypothetical protein E4U58_000788 [Claviceps cyperi]